MFDSFGSLFNKKPQQKGGPLVPESSDSISPIQRASADRRPTYSKVFRWRLPDGQTEPPKSVEVAGTFNHWQKVTLLHDSTVGGWHVTIHHIAGNRTHHYMLWVDGKPAHDKNCDGMAVPVGAAEENAAMTTPRGPRVFMLFAQTK